ncbi:MAG TPA: sigma-70 family RNA polymerase sigma factor [Dehalococcoidia bacterium]|nr:sigma-70 family RNA polymerase sigma factor [Dehalococcoidia bacterium]
MSAVCQADFEELYRRHHRRVLAYIRRQVNDPELAQDLAADTFLQAFLGFHRLQRLEAGLSWLLTISRRTVSAYLRHHRRLSLQPWGWPTAEVSDPCQGLEEEELAAALHQAVRSLPARQREALLLRFVHGLPGPQVARVMGIQHGTARLLLHRAIGRLRADLGRYAEAG